jgi:hypothetical protein
MNVRKILGILAVAGLTALVCPPQNAKAQMLSDPKPGVASSETAKPKVSRPRSHKARGHWRHRGGRHPNFGRRY